MNISIVINWAFMSPILQVHFNRLIIINNTFMSEHARTRGYLTWLIFINLPPVAWAKFLNDYIQKWIAIYYRVGLYLRLEPRKVAGRYGGTPHKLRAMPRNTRILQGARKKYINIYSVPQINILLGKDLFLCIMRGYPGNWLQFES